MTRKLWAIKEFIGGYRQLMAISFRAGLIWDCRVPKGGDARESVLEFEQQVMSTPLSRAYQKADHRICRARLAWDNPKIDRDLVLLREISSGNLDLTAQLDVLEVEILRRDYGAV